MPFRLNRNKYEPDIFRASPHCLIEGVPFSAIPEVEEYLWKYYSNLLTKSLFRFVLVSTISILTVKIGSIRFWHLN